MVNKGEILRSRLYLLSLYIHKFRLCRFVYNYQNINHIEP